MRSGKRSTAGGDAKAAPRTARDLLRRLYFLYSGGLILVLGANLVLWRQTEWFTLSNADMALTLGGLLLAPSCPALGTIIAIIAIIVGVAFQEPTASALILPTAAMMLTYRHSMWRMPLFALLLAAGYSDAFQYPSVAASAVVALYLTMLLVGGAVLGRLFRTAIGKLREVEADVSRADQCPSLVRREERTALASELVALLEADLSTLPSPAKGLEASPAVLRQALEAAVADAKHSLRNLRALIATLRGTEARPQGSVDLEQLETALEAAEDQLVGHGFTVELPIEALPSIPASQAAILSSFFREATDNIIRHGAPGTSVVFEVDADQESLTASVWNESHADIAAPPGAGLRALGERIALAGGQLDAGIRAGRWQLVARLPFSPAPAARRGLQLSAGWRFLAFLQMRHQWLLTALFLGLALTYVVALPLAKDAQGITTGLWGLLGVALLIVAVWERRLGLLLLIGYGASTLISAVPLGADQWILVVALLYAIIGLRHPATGLALGALLTYAVLRVLSQPEPSVSALTLVELMTPSIVLATVILLASAFLQAKKAELSQLADEQRSIRQGERQALAGELHDVLAHHLSLIVMEAEQYVDSDDVDAMQRVLVNVARRNEAALVDLSMLAFVLRDDESSASDPERALELGPSAAAEGLCAAITDQGFEPLSYVDAKVATLDRPIQHTVTRVLREAVTNALRYSREHSTIILSAGVAPDGETTVRVTSELDAHQVADRSGLSTGSGLRGLAERVSLMGGEFFAGRRGPEWIVEATLPGKLDPASLTD